MDKPESRAVFEDKKDATLAAISSFLISLLSFFIFSNSPSLFFDFRPDTLAVLSMVIGLIVFKSATTPKARISIGKGDRYIEYMYVHKSGKKFEGTVKLKDIVSLTVTPEVEQEDYFTENELNDEELWRTALSLKFSNEFGDHEINISGRVPNYQEAVISLRAWGYLISSDGDAFYQLNPTKS